MKVFDDYISPSEYYNNLPIGPYAIIDDEECTLSIVSTNPDTIEDGQAVIAMIGYEGKEPTPSDIARIRACFEGVVQIDQFRAMLDMQLADETSDQ